MTGRTALALGALLVPQVWLATGCAEALFSRVSSRSHTAYTDADYAAYRSLRERGDVGKAEVLTALGPPLQVLAQDTGDVFVYRRLIREATVVNLNPSAVSGFGPPVPVPLYFRSAVSGRDDTLMIFFDAQGRLRGDSLRLGIEDPPGRGGGE